MSELGEYYKYLTVNEEDKSWGLHLTVTGMAQIEPDIEYPPKGHPSGYLFTWERGRTLDEFQIIYITQGSGIMETEDGAFTINPGSILVIRPGEWHRYRPNINTGWREHYIGFEGLYAEHIFSKGFFKDTPPVIHVGFQDPILVLYYRIQDLCKEEKSGYQQVISGVLVQVLGSIISCVKNKDFEGKDIERKIRKARIYFRDNLDKNIEVEQLAADLNIGYSYFRRMFKKFTGISPVQYHLMLRLQRAKDLLISTDMSVKEIALELGFQSIFYFTRIFKSKTGMAPTEFRKKV